jgi:hypothetical protein
LYLSANGNGEKALDKDEDAEHYDERDTTKESMVYNAQVWLKAFRQEEERTLGESRFPKRRTLVYVGLAAFSLIALYSLLDWLVIYDSSRYLVVFSAVIQGVSTIFALVAAGTLLLMERVGGRSPKSLSFLPNMWVTGIFSVFVIIIALDVLTMVAMPSDAFWSWLTNALLVSNVASVGLSAVYVKTLLRGLQPDVIFDILLKRGIKAKSKAEASEIIDAAEDLGINAIQDRNKSTVMTAIATCENLSRHFCQKWKRENPGYDLRHPIRLTADCVERIGREAVLARMYDISGPCVNALCRMGFYHFDNGIHIDVWIFGNITTITEDAMNGREATDCIDNVVLWAKVAADFDKLSLANWLICCFDDIARSAGNCKNYDAARTLATGIEILAETFADKPTSSGTVNRMQEAVDVLKKFSKDKEFGSYTGYLGERGWPSERTILDILEKIEVQIQSAKKKTFDPASGDWPAP